MSTPYNMPPETRIHVACPLSNGLRVGCIEISTNGTILFGYSVPGGGFAYISLWDVKYVRKNLLPELREGGLRARQHFKELGEERDAIMSVVMSELGVN
jgi:hypothetical protein